MNSTDFKVDGTRPEHYCFCSASWRLNTDLFRRFARTKDEVLQLGTLLTINRAIGQLTSFTDAIYENFHTIADDLVVAYRCELVNAFRRVHLPTADPPLGIPCPTNEQ